MELSYLVGLYILFVGVKALVSYLQFNHIKENYTKPILLDSSTYKVSADYALIGEKLSLLSLMVEFIFFIFWIFFGLKWLDSLIVIENSILKAVIFINVFMVINFFTTLPIELYSKFVIDKKFGFSNITKTLFIKDLIKSSLMSIVIGSLVVAGISWFVELSQYWWFYSFIFLFSVIILINMLFPTIRALMFDKFTSIDDTELGQEVRSLLKKEGFEISGIFKVDASKRDNRLNAYFGGLGKTKRVVLYDTLMEKLTKSELLAVLGHELGHFKNKDIIKNIATVGLLLFTFLYIFGNLPDKIFTSLDISKNPHTLITIFMIFSTPLFFFFMPIFNILSRHNEFAADDFGGKLESKESLAMALKKLSIENKKFPRSHKLHKIFYETHPGVVERIEKLGGLPQSNVECDVCIG